MPNVYLVESRIRGPLGIYTTAEKAYAASISQFKDGTINLTPTDIRKIVNDNDLTIKVAVKIEKKEAHYFMSSRKATRTNVVRALGSRVEDGSVTISGDDVDGESYQLGQITISVFPLNELRR